MFRRGSEVGRAMRTCGNALGQAASRGRVWPSGVAARSGDRFWGHSRWAARPLRRTLTGHTVVREADVLHFLESQGGVARPVVESDNRTTTIQLRRSRASPELVLVPMDGHAQVPCGWLLWSGRPRAVGPGRAQPGSNAPSEARGATERRVTLGRANVGSGDIHGPDADAYGGHHRDRGACGPARASPNRRIRGQTRSRLECALRQFGNRDGRRPNLASERATRIQVIELRG